MKGCPPSKKSQMSFWKGVCVGGKGHGVGVRVRVDKTALFCSVGSDAGVVSTEGAVGTPLKEAHTLPLFFLPTLSEPSPTL